MLLHLYIKNALRPMTFAAGTQARPRAAIILIMTQLEVLYRYEQHPTEAAMFALGKAREVYGVRRVLVDQDKKTILVEYDATRLSNPVLLQLLRGAGIDIVEELPLIPPQAVEPATAAPAAAK
jgi:hypothetical protein